MSKLEKVEKKVSLNIKISSDLDAKLKEARFLARKSGMKYNVSEQVEKFLSRNVDSVLKELKK